MSRQTVVVLPANPWARPERDEREERDQEGTPEPVRVGTKEPPPAFRCRPPMEWDPLPYMDEYLAELRAEEMTEGYVRMVKVGLAYFALWARDQDIKHPEEITRRHVVRYQAHLMTVQKRDGTGTLAQSYRQQLMRYLRSWVGWLVDLEYVTQDPWVRIRIGTTPKKPKPLEQDELLALFDAHRSQAFTVPPFVFHRREVILTLLYAWGLRLHELQAINVSHVDMRLDWVTARNKGGGTKTLPYGPALKGVVTRWLGHRARYAVPGEDALIIDQQGNRLSRHMLNKIVTDCGVRAGVAINPHRLRDTFGTTMLEGDVEVERIMKMMGHTSPRMTLSYARVGDRKVAESHQRVMGPILGRLLGETTGTPEVPEPTEDERLDPVNRARHRRRRRREHRYRPRGPRESWEEE